MARPQDARAGAGASGGTAEAEANVLRRLIESFGGGLDIEKVSTAVVDIVVEEIGAVNCSLYLLDAEAGELVLAAARGRGDGAANFHPEGGGYKSFALGEGVCGIVARDGRPILIDDVTCDERFIPLTPLASEVRSLLTVPLLSAGGVVGVLNLSHSDLGAFSEANESLLSLVSTQAGIALSNVQLFRSLSEAHEQLSLSERRFREVFSRANEPFILIDESGEVVEANSAWELFAGVERTGWGDLEIESSDGGTSSLGDFLRREAFVRDGVRLEAALSRPEGPTSVVEISSKAFPVENEELCLVLVRDLTEKKKLAEQLIRSEKLAAVGEVTAALAHEINSPLGALYNAVSLLRSDLALAGDDERLMQVAVEEAARLSEIVNDFLSFARFPQARFDWEDINELVSASLFLMKRDERMGPHISVEKDLAENLAACQLDRGQFQEVVFNLLCNALDAMEDGGTLTVKTYNAKLGEKPAVGFLVQDTGHGVGPGDKEKLFQPFYTTKDVGTGLGLPIVKRIVEEHGGTISLESDVGKGASVSVVLPLSREEALWPRFS